jgi:dTDP-4-dehydrorhamnose reductase
MQLLILGAKGQLGHEIQALQVDFPQFALTLADLAELDITNETAVKSFFATQKFDACVNCAAYTAVDKAESEVELCRSVNALAPALLASACREQGAKFVHISSDYVYHNGLNRPLREDDPTQAQSVYAQTKLEGDLNTLAANPEALVFRTSWVYSSFGHNFVKTMQRLGRERDELRVVFDQVGAPTYARDLARMILHTLADEGLRKNQGVYNFCNHGVTSWYDFALAIHEISGIQCRVVPILSAEYPTPASRPPYSVLDKSKFERDFGLPIPHWREALRECLGKMEA